MTKVTQFALFIVIMTAFAAFFIHFPRLAGWFGHVNQVFAFVFMIGYGAYVVKGTVVGQFGTGPNAISRERPLPFYGLVLLGLLFELYLVLDFLGVRMPWAR